MIDGIANKHHPMYRGWVHMHQRCKNDKRWNYKYYGGRGIKVCDEWESFERFVADVGPRPEGKTLDRIDQLGDYCKENVRWATASEQANNRSTNRRLVARGEDRTLAEWGRVSGVRPLTILARIDNLGWPVERAIFEPPRAGARG